MYSCLSRDFIESLTCAINMCQLLDRFYKVFYKMKEILLNFSPRYRIILNAATFKRFDFKEQGENCGFQLRN